MTSDGGLYSNLDLVLARNDDPEDVLERASSAGAWAPFSAAAVDFISDLSGLVLKDPRFRQHPELVAFGYQMRRKAVEALAPTRVATSSKGVVRGRGLALHFAPANVDTIFLYSLLLSLLAGNANVVRLSSKVSSQVDLVIDALRILLGRPEHAAIRDRIILVRYPHDQQLTDALTAMCRLRVIWGGDTGVAAIRRSPLPMLARDVVFPDRWSMAVVDAEAFLAAADASDLARRFVNDAYWFGQMACSSPRLFLWRGDQETASKAALLLFNEMAKHAGAFADDLQAVDYVNKRVFEDASAIDSGATRHAAATNLVSVLEVPLDGVARSVTEHVGSGMFLNSRVSDLQEAAGLMGRKLQTVVSFGVSADDWTELLTQADVGGIDRIVPPGAALDFASVWDGMNLLTEFTRETTIAAAAEPRSEAP